MSTVKFVSEPLNTTEAQKFFDQFFEIDLAKMVKASVVMCESPNQGKFVIELSYPGDEHHDYFIRATFKDGMMQHWGWDKKFTEIPSEIDDQTLEENLKTLNLSDLNTEETKSWFKEWFMTPNPAFNNATPQSLMGTEGGIETVGHSLGVIFFGNCA